MSRTQYAVRTVAPAPHASSRLKLAGNLDEDALRRALDEVLAGLAANAGVARPSFELSITELAYASAQERGTELDAMIDWDTRLPFELPHGPLLRARVIHMGADAQVFLLTAHRSVCACWPVRRLQAAVAARYLALRDSCGWGAPLPRALDMPGRLPRVQASAGTGRAISRRENSRMPATLMISPSSTPNGAPITPNCSNAQ